MQQRWRLIKGFGRKWASRRLGVGTCWPPEVCAWCKRGTKTSNMDKCGIPGSSTAYRTGSNKILGVLQLALGHQLPYEGKYETWKCFDDGGGCDPSFLRVCGKRVCAACWCWTERRVRLGGSHVCDTGEVQSKRRDAVLYSCSLSYKEGLADGSTAARDDVVDNQVRKMLKRQRVRAAEGVNWASQWPRVWCSTSGRS